MPLAAAQAPLRCPGEVRKATNLDVLWPGGRLRHGLDEGHAGLLVRLKVLEHRHSAHRSLGERAMQRRCKGSCGRREGAKCSD
eukprot:scaffold62_cov256-Pinguiococcus_pyrenoidosus.AAC.26